MNSSSDKQLPRDVTPHIEALLQLLPLKGNLAAIWKAGDWLDTYFGGEQANKGEVDRVAKALEKIAENGVPVSVNHLQKCRQFRLTWEANDVETAVEVGLPWRHAIQLTLIKRYAKGLKKTRPARALDIRLKWDGLITSFPGSKKTNALKEWTERVKAVKRESQENNLGNNQERLWVDCWKAANFRLIGAKTQIDKMYELLSDDRLKLRADAARKRVDAAIEKMKKIYTPKKTKQKNPGEGAGG